jgi:hypothetical protein
MLKIFLILITGIILLKCTSKKSIQTERQKNNFFPVTQYLLAQVNELDTLPVTPLKIITIHQRTDSQWIKKEEIRSFVLPFLTPVIDSVSLHNYFSQRSFLDQTINAFTFSYDPITELPDTLQVKRWDIYVDPNTGNITRIYIVKQVNNDTTSHTLQLTWKSGYYCQVTTITEKNGTAPEIKQEKLIWNFND